MVIKTHHAKCITDFSKSMQIGDVVIIKRGDRNYWVMEL